MSPEQHDVVAFLLFIALMVSIMAVVSSCANSYGVICLETAKQVASDPKSCQ